LAPENPLLHFSSIISWLIFIGWICRYSHKWSIKPTPDHNYLPGLELSMFLSVDKGRISVIPIAKIRVDAKLPPVKMSTSKLSTQKRRHCLLTYIY
jgi:hypothetical protein